MNSFRIGVMVICGLLAGTWPARGDAQTDARVAALEQVAAEGWVETIRTTAALVKALQAQAPPAPVLGVTDLRYENLFRAWLMLEGKEPLIRGEQSRRHLLHSVSDDYRLCIDQVGRPDDPLALLGRADTLSQEEFRTLFAQTVKNTFGDASDSLGVHSVEDYKAAVRKFRANCVEAIRAVEKLKPR